MEQTSENFSSLSSEANEKYETQVVCAGHWVDPYRTENWTEAPEEVPDVRWSDMLLYMVSTLSPHAREKIKVVSRRVQTLIKVNIWYAINTT